MTQNSKGKQNRKVLVVDDEPRMLEAVAMNLEVEGYQVVGASSGHEALRKITAELPDLIILDVMMPEMDGFETLREIRDISTVPVIMLTVKGEETDGRPSISAAVGWLSEATRFISDQQSTGSCTT